jgi:hypothetical protein
MFPFKGIGAAGCGVAGFCPWDLDLHVSKNLTQSDIYIFLASPNNAGIGVLQGGVDRHHIHDVL